jgi:hypothetical protein
VFLKNDLSYIKGLLCKSQMVDLTNIFFEIV